CFGGTARGCLRVVSWPSSLDKRNLTGPSAARTISVSRFGLILELVTQRNDKTARRACTAGGCVPGRERASQLTGTKTSPGEQAAWLAPTASKRGRLLYDIGVG